MFIKLTNLLSNIYKLKYLIINMTRMPISSIIHIVVDNDKIESLTEWREKYKTYGIKRRFQELIETDLNTNKEENIDEIPVKKKDLNNKEAWE